MEADQLVDALAASWGVSVQDVGRPERGANNLVWFLNGAFVLRVYQNLTEAQVEAEHRLLRGLQEIDLPFEVPAPIPIPSGGTYVATEHGPAALYRMLGGRPARDGDLAELTLVGAALGELMLGLAQVPTDLSPRAWRVPLAGIHPAVPDVGDLIRELRRVAPNADGLDVMGASWSALDAAQLAMDLPSQICHLDVSPGNVLVEGGRVVAFLDFEVAGWDLRVNDLAAALEQSTDTTPEADALLAGFRAKVDLSAEEWAAIPTLRLLRQIATVVWRAGRWREGKSTLDDVRARLAAIRPVR